MSRPRFSICGDFLLFLFLVPSVSISAPSSSQSGFSQFQKIPKHPPVKIPKLPESPPAATTIINACTDSDGGVDSEHYGIARKSRLFANDRCRAGLTPAKTFWGKIIQWMARVQGNTSLLTAGEHFGAYNTLLDEAICNNFCSHPSRPR